MNGQLAAKTMTLASGTVTALSVAAAAGIEATKLQHQHQPVYCQDQIAYADTRVLHVAYGDGTTVAFKAGIVTAFVGDATATVNLHKNGVSVLSSAITLDNANTARVVEAGTINTTSYVAGDVFEVVVTVNAGTGTLGKGLFCHAVLREDAQ